MEIFPVGSGAEAGGDIVLPEYLQLTLGKLMKHFILWLFMSTLSRDCFVHFILWLFIWWYCPLYPVIVYLVEEAGKCDLWLN